MTNEETFNSLTKAQWVDQACDRFETAWRAGQPVSIESIIEASPESAREALVNELVAIEIELRRKQGESLSAEEFVRRFPHIDPNVANFATALASNDPSSLTDQPTIDSPERAGFRKHDDFIGTSIQYLGDYVLLEQIARGGMGIVYKARQQTLGRIVAVKMILGGQFAEKQDIDRFHSEATAAAKLDHPGIVPIYEVGEQDGHHFYSMGFVEGGSLAQRLQEGPLPARESADLLAKITDAVHYAHLKGVIHRDIKPANILIDANGQPRVTDFGLAKLVKGSSDITRSGQILGTPSYMPPEQAAAQASAIGPASDVYSLGALLYSLLTGRPPFQAASPIETLLQVQKQEPVSPRQFNTNIPIDLETITLKCLDKSPARRYATADELAQELRRYLIGKPILARPVSRAEQAWRWCRRNPAVASLATFIMLLISGIAVGSAWAYFRESSLRKELKVAFDNQKELTASERQAKLEEATARKAADAAKVVADRATVDARKAAEEAELARKEKEHQAEIAQQEKEKAKASEELTRRNLYVSDMARIAELIQEPNLSRAKSLLERHIPTTPSEEDLRGFDWYYCWRQVSQETWARQFKESVEVIDLSEDERTLAVGCKGGRAYLMDVDSGKVQDCVFAIDDEHWSSLAFIQDERLIGHGRQGEFKVWNYRSGETIATKESGYAHYRRVGTPWEGRVSTAVDPTGKFMIGADFGNMLALWNLKTLRPLAIPFINDGDHSYNYQGRTNSHLFSSGLPKIASSSAGYLDDKRLEHAGAKDWDDYLIRMHIENHSQEYRPVGFATTLPFQNLESLARVLGHPITCIAFSESHNGRFLTGNRYGDIQYWNRDDIENLDRWVPASFPKIQHRSLPIRSVALSPNENVSAACDSETCTIFRTFDFQKLMNVAIPKNAVTKILFCDEDQLALGTESGIVEVWSLSKSVRTHRFFVSHGSITDLAYSPSRTSLLASNADGTLTAFPLNEVTMPMVPMRDSWLNFQYSSLVWLKQSRKLVFPRILTNELMTFDVSETKKPTQFDLTSFEPSNMIRLGQSIIFKERRSVDELVTVYREWIVRWDRTNGKLKSKTDYYQHQSREGSAFLISSDRHPHRGYLFKEDKTTEVSIPQGSIRLATTTGIRSADLFDDERRLALVIDNGQFAQLMVRDVDSGAVLSDLRIADLRCLENQFPTIACLDEQRVLVSGLIPEGSTEELDLIWDTKDDRVSRIKSPTVSEQTRVARGLDARPTQRYVLRTNDPDRIVIWDKGRIRFIDTQSLQAEEVPLPEKSRLFIAHLGSANDLCVVSYTPSKSFGWQEWNQVTSQWELKFELDETWQPYAHESNWCIDPDRGTLFHMPEGGVIQRWSVSSGKRLSPIHIPFGSIDKIYVDAIGRVGALMNCKVSQFEYPSSLHWFDRGKQIASDRINIRLLQGWLGFAPLHSAGQWLVPEGVKSIATEENPDISPFDLTTPLATSPDTKLVVSESSKHLIQTYQSSIWQWLLKEPIERDKPAGYQYVGSHRLPLQTKLESIDISPSGARLAVADKSSVQWSIQPFEEWKAVPVSTTADIAVTALKWSSDNQTLAIGLNTGDMLHYHADSDTIATFSRGHQGAINDILWLPDRRTIATAGNDGNLVHWDIALREIRLRIPAHQGPVHSLAFDSHSQSIFSAGDDGYIRTWLGAKREMTPTKGFVSPDPQAMHQERAAEPTAEALRQRAVRDWLKEHQAQYEMAKFGIRGNYAVKSADEMSVRSITITNAQSLSDNDLARFSHLQELRSLDLSGCALTENGLKYLVGLQGLQTLNLSEIDISRFSFDVLKDSSNLTTLDLSGCSISDEQLLAIIRLFPKLQVLELTDARVTDASVGKIDALKYLRQLELESTEISSTSLTAIGRLGQLSFLGLNRTAIDPKDISQLGSLKNLTELRLRGTSIDDLGLSQMPKWPSFKKIDLRDTEVTSTGIAVLQGHSNKIEAYVSSKLFGDSVELEAFCEIGPLRGTAEVDDKSMPAWSAAFKLAEGGSITGLTWPVDRNRDNQDEDELTKFSKLKKIKLASDANPSKHLPILEKIPGLEELEIESNPSCTESDLKSVGKLQHLKRLKIYYLTDEKLRPLASLSKLESISYQSGVKIDELAKALPNLKTIKCPEIAKRELDRAIPFLTSLEILSIRKSPKEDTWAGFAKLKNLKELNLPSSYSKSDLKKLQVAQPNVQIQVMK